ncbi:Mg2+ transporter protein, CorA-like/Zinc transport protein ZntB [Penicillium italicum]|uniref:Mg2+ transporter protein, CorA-like/Zinc transport protein ZntB n=1 Tax=Penicillium italicum TaxID=40296 RepID=A0A0A2KV85_PENIT|nr:Mg2+ transporter protein, CorA-like/Zinc transport protein ZntB [Penicillium italicum]
MYRPKMALIGPTFVDESTTYEPSQTFEPTKGSLDSLSRLFGRQLNADCAQQDAFYALSELFALSAFSVNQTFNLVEQCMNSQVNSSIEDMQISLESLRQANNFINGRVVRLHETLAHIRTRGSHAKWPRASTTKEQELAESVANESDHSYQHLLNRATSLTNRIKSESEWLMHKAMLNESQRAFYQGYNMTRITFLAFLFIPLSFTASVFGMNVIELANDDGPKLSIWYWVVVSIVVFAAGLLAWYWDKIKHLIKKIFYSDTAQKN